MFFRKLLSWNINFNLCWKLSLARFKFKLSYSYRLDSFGHFSERRVWAKSLLIQFEIFKVCLNFYLFFLFAIMFLLSILKLECGRVLKYYCNIFWKLECSLLNITKFEGISAERRVEKIGFIFIYFWIRF